MEQLLSEAVELVKDGQCEDALYRLELISPEQLPDGARADFLYWKGSALFYLNRYEEAEQVARRGVCDFRNDGRFYGLIGEFLSEGGREEDSLIYFAKASELMPKDTGVVFEWGYALYKLERDEEAVARFEEALEIDPKCRGAVQYLGEIYSADNDCDKALEVYSRYLDHSEDDHLILVEAAICLSDMERFDEAIEYYQRAIDVHPSYTYAYYNWAVSLWRAGRLDEAVDQIRKCLDAETHFPVAWMLWGRLELTRGNREKVIDKLDRGLKLARNSHDDDIEMNSWCYESYFESMVEMEEWEKAQAIFWEAARSNILTPHLLEQWNADSYEEMDGLSCWWVLLDVRLYEPVSVKELDGANATGYFCGFNVLAHDPDEAIDFAVEFERSLGEGEAVAEECILQEEKQSGIPGLTWVYPNRNYYSCNSKN